MNEDDGSRASFVGRRVALMLVAAGCSACVATSSRREAPGAGTGGANASARASLFPICVGRRFGFIDRSGSVVVPPKLGWIDETIGELTKVWVVFPVPPGEEQPGHPPAGRAGFVDTRGRFVVEPDYEDAHPFSEGLAAVEREGNWGYVDVRGKIRIPLQFDSARPFSDGLALVKDGAGQRFIDAGGRTVVDVSRIRWRRAGEDLPVVAEGPFLDGLAAFTVFLRGETPDVLTGFMDRQGRIVVEPAFTYASAFQEGYAKVRIACGGGIGGNCEGIIRRDGSWAIPPTYEFLSGVNGGLVNFTAPVGKRRLHGFLNERNEVVIPPRYEHSCLRFSEGLCQAKIGRRWAYVDRSGAEVLVLPPDAESAERRASPAPRARAPRPRVPP